MHGRDEEVVLISLEAHLREMDRKGADTTLVDALIRAGGRRAPQPSHRRAGRDQKGGGLMTDPTFTRLLDEIKTAAFRAVMPDGRCPLCGTARAETTAEPRPVSAFAPTEKQVAFYKRLAGSPVFTEDERRRALEWLATKATKQTIKDQIDWLKGQVEARRNGRA